MLIIGGRVVSAEIEPLDSIVAVVNNDVIVRSELLREIDLVRDTTP
jgi:hypothetical protein